MSETQTSKQAVFLTGDLDRLFTVLFEMGKIEPLLNKDWKPLYRKMMVLWPEVSGAINQINNLANLKDLRSYLDELNPEVLEALCIEVAREMADYYDNEKVLH